MNFLHKRFFTAEWAFADYLAAFFAVVGAVALGISIFTAPDLYVRQMNAVTDGQNILVDAEIYPTKTFRGEFLAEVRDARTGTKLCPTGKGTHVYRRAVSYRGPETLSWWTDGVCSTADLPPGKLVRVDTEYLLPGYLWGFLPQRSVRVRTNPILVPSPSR